MPETGPRGFAVAQLQPLKTGARAICLQGLEPGFFAAIRSHEPNFEMEYLSLIHI